MRKRMFTIITVASLPLIAVVLLFSQGLFSTPDNAVETYIGYEKQLSKLFVQYSKQSDTMTDEELNAWQTEVDDVSTKTAKAMVKIQKDPEDWKTYLESTGQPYRPSPLAELEYTGLAAKSLKEITSDQFDAWWSAQAKQDDDHQRVRLRADGIWDDEKIEEVIAASNESLANDPERQYTKKRMRELVIWNEGRADRERERAEKNRKEAAYQAERAKEKAWRASEEAALAKMYDEETLSEPQDTPTEQSAVPKVKVADAMPPVEQPTANNKVDQEGIQTPQQPKPPRDKPFNPSDFALTLSEDMSRWDDTLQELYQDVFNLDESFEQRLPEQARHFFNQRRQRLQFEYVTRLENVLRDTPRENRANTLSIVREKLSDNWDADFADAVMRQLQSEGE